MKESFEHFINEFKNEREENRLLSFVENNFNITLNDKQKSCLLLLFISFDLI